MKFYIDSADIEEIEKAIKLGYVQGVTTNPTLLKKARVWEKFENLHEFYSYLLKISNVEIFIQVPSKDYEYVLKELNGLDLSRIVVKIPSVPAGLDIARRLIYGGYITCATAVYTASQAAMWATLGVDYVAVYVNRMEKRGFDAEENISMILNVLKNSKAKVLAASVKKVEQLSFLLKIGVEHFTLNYRMLDAVTKCDFSLSDVKTFDADMEEVRRKFKDGFSR